MRKFTLTLFQLTAAIIFLCVCSCSKNTSTKKTITYTIYSNPVYKSKSQVLSAINASPSTQVEHAGKMYLKDNFIFINDVNKGIHVFDNSNPSHPTQVAFLAIPGNIDIAVKNNILYADMFDELLALDISNIHNVKVTDTIANFFPGRSYLNSFAASVNGQVVVDWTEKDTTVFTTDVWYPGQCNTCMFAASSSPKSNMGVAGSMAGMVLMNDYLYAITEMHSLGIVDVNNAAHPKLDSSFFAGFDLETIYPFEDKLFLGSAIGTFMYDVTNPQQPKAIGSFTHGRACDPVIADGNYAYVTLHSGTSCGGDANELDVVNIKDIANSKLIKTYNLKSPTGLSKNGNWLFVCDDDKVNIYNASDPTRLSLVEQIISNNPYDVIAMNNRLVVVDANGIAQYDYSNMANIRMLSFIAAKQ